MSKLTEAVLVEKYRPNKLDNVAGAAKNALRPYLDKNESLPHFIFYSTSPGTGKTTLARAFANDLGCDILILNSSDDRKIETVREKVKVFASSVSSKTNKKKCIFCDEADGMTRASQDALRNVMETYAANCFFILSCNHVNKIIDPIKSRCILIDFSRCFSRDETIQYIKDICIKESLDVTLDLVEKIVDLNKPNIRNMVMFLQRVKVSGNEILQEIERKDVFEEFWISLKEKKFGSIRNLIEINNLDVEVLNKWLLDKLLSNPKDLPISKVVKMIRIIADNERDFVMGADKKLMFLSSMFGLMMVD